MPTSKPLPKDAAPVCFEPNRCYMFGDEAKSCQEQGCFLKRRLKRAPRSARWVAMLAALSGRR